MPKKLALLAGMLFCALLAKAQNVTFYYTGATFTNAACVNAYSGSYSSSCPSLGNVTGSITFTSAAVSAGSASATLGVTSSTIVGASFTGGANSVSSADNCLQGTFTFSSGAITSWAFDMFTYYGCHTATSAQLYNYVEINSSVHSGPYYDRTHAQMVVPSLPVTSVGASPSAGSWSTTPPPPTFMKSGGNPHNIPGLAASGDPITLSTGNVYSVITDYQTAGQNQLAFIRSYNSQSSNTSILGRNWRSNFDRSFVFNSSTSISIERADGQGVDFTYTGGAWQTDNNVEMKLTSYSGFGSTTLWLLTDRNDTVEIYDQASGANTAQLATISLRNSFSQYMHYTSGKLTSVSDDYSRTLNFTYTGSLLTSVTTPDSLTLSYAYDGVNRLTSVSYNTSPVTSQTYLYENSFFPFALTGITDENGNRYASWTYDSSGRATSSSQGGTLNANLTAVAYNSNGTVTLTDPAGVQFIYTFIPNYHGQQVVYHIDRQATSATPGGTRYFLYDGNSYIYYTTNWGGIPTSITNDAHGQPTSITESYGTGSPRTTTYTYDPTFHLVTQKVEDGVTTDYAYDAAGNLLTKKLTDTTTTTTPYSTSGQTRIWTYTYDGTGLLLSEQRPIGSAAGSGYTTTYSYTGGTLTSITDALSHTTNITSYTGGGLPLTVTDANSVQTDLAYDARLRLHTNTLHTAGGNRVTTYDHDAAGNLTKITPADNAWFSFSYDNAHRLTSIASAGGYSKNMTLDAAGHATQTLWKDSGGTTKRQHSATFDAIGNMITSVGGAGQTTTISYDESRPYITTDALSHTYSTSWDLLGRSTYLQDPTGHNFASNVDSHNRPTDIFDKNSHQTSYVYNGFGDTLQEASTDRGTTVYTYDKDGNVLTKVDGASNTLTYTYDQLDRELTRVYTGDSSLSVTKTYDQTGHGKGIGRLTSITDQAGTHSRSYDERGAITADARTIGSTTYTTTNAYNAAGKLSSITYPGAGWTVAYTRDSSGDVSGVTATPSGGSPVTIASSIVHLPFGPFSSLTWGNGVTGTITRDLDYRMTHTTAAGTSGNLLDLAYVYDAANNLSTITDGVSGANSATYCYDALDRITGFSASATAGCGSPTYTYAYDLNNNRTSGNGYSDSFSSTKTQFSSYRGSSVSYNGNGNITAIAATSATMTYNKANQLASISAGGNGYTYTFDAFGQRLTAAQSGYYPRIYQYGPGGFLLMETSGSSTNGIETDYIYLDGTPIAALTPSTSSINYIHGNRIGAPTLATDASKAVSWTATYDPFGGAFVVGSPNISVRLPGQFIDNTGYYHNGARDYDPQQGRYIQFDPRGLKGGFNPYVYASNNSFKKIDPSGLDGEDEEAGEKYDPPVLTEDPEELRELSRAAARSRQGAASVGSTAGDQLTKDAYPACMPLDTLIELDRPYNLRYDGTAQDFERDLESKGYSRGYAKDGTLLYTKGSTVYSYYPNAESTGGPTFQRTDSNDVTGKWRLTR